MTTRQLKTRRSLQEIYTNFKNGKDTVTLEKLMVAWQFIKALPASDPNSFMALGGFHGEPFVWRGSYDIANYWGGYCHHGSVLFPTWHRVYLYKLEKALQSVPGCESVMLPYWDQTYKITVNGQLTYLGVPPILTDEYFTFTSGVTIPNPLKSFILPMTLQDGEEANFYSKPSGYETVRYPLAGLVGRPADVAASEVNNSAYYIAGTKVIDQKLTTSLLNANVISWLNGTISLPSASGGAPASINVGIDQKYHASLMAPCYTVFSNTASAARWNKDNSKGQLTQAVESPHNEIHLAVGGIDTPFQNDDTPFSPQNFPFRVADANGDMAENETAALDPIFFFHHCNVDRVFWIWQVNNKSKDMLDLTVPGWDDKKGPYPGTNNNGNQAPVGYESDEQLTMESPLYPFKLVENGDERNYRSNDAVNIETQLGYTYDNLSIDNSDGAAETTKAITTLAGLSVPAGKSDKVLIVSGINRAKINGSFVILAYATIDGSKHFLGTYSVLSRWKVVACKNCITNPEVTAVFSLYQFTEEEVNNAIFEIQINGRRGNEDEFAKFRLANQANVNKFLSAREARAPKLEAITDLAFSTLQSVNDKMPFALSVI